MRTCARHWRARARGWPSSSRGGAPVRKFAIGAAAAAALLAWASFTFAQALERAIAPLRSFMLRQTRESDLALMVSLSRGGPPRAGIDLPTHVLVPAFAVSEIKTAFQIGFVLFVPFLIIDIVVASVLMS